MPRQFDVEIIWTKTFRVTVPGELEYFEAQERAIELAQENFDRPTADAEEISSDVEIDGIRDTPVAT